MTTYARDDLLVLDIGPPAWCWARLASRSQATLSFSAPHGRFSLDVRYSLHDEQIAIALPASDAVAWQAAGRSATLKISGTNDDGLRWSVRVSGHAHRAGGHLLCASADDPGRRGARSRPAWLALSSCQVRGHYETVAFDDVVRVQQT